MENTCEVCQVGGAYSAVCAHNHGGLRVDASPRRFVCKKCDQWMNEIQFFKFSCTKIVVQTGLRVVARVA